MARYRQFLLAMLFVVFLLAQSGGIASQTNKISSGNQNSSSSPAGFGLDLYQPIDTVPLNVKEQMTLSPMFTPDNALDIHIGWINQANTSIKIQNQYIKYIYSGKDWGTGANPLVTALVTAANRGVNIQVQVRDDSDSYDIAGYLNGLSTTGGIEVRYMGNSTSANGGWLSATHNKICIIDSKVTLLSSINYGTAFTNNREAGMVIQSPTVTAYYEKFIDADWLDGQILPATNSLNTNAQISQSPIGLDFASPTNIPKTNFTGNYNVTAFVNPDNANDVIFDYLNAAKQSIYVSMYTISRQDFVDSLVNLKKNNPSIDIQVLISKRRVGGSENIDTKAAAEELVSNLIPVYNSTSDLEFYHNKYWIIDGKHTFVYSGNWSPHSVTVPETEYTSDPNRDMGIAVLDAPDIANFFKTQVWDPDVAVGSAWNLPIGITQTSFDQADVVSGTVNLQAVLAGINATSVSYRFGSTTFSTATVTNNAISIPIDTTTLSNGIQTFEIKVESGGQTFTDSVDVTVANYASSENWRVLITEVLPNPDGISDTEGEFIELTNSFPFAVLLEGWIIGDDNGEFQFPVDYSISAYSSLIFARSKAGFDGFFSVTADFEVGISLTNTGDGVFLLNNKGTAVDAIAWGNGLALDGSERADAPDAGISIQRSPLYLDTNTKSDFSEATPSPKATVDHQPLLLPGETPTDTSTDSLPFTVVPVLIALISIIPVRRKYFWSG